MKQYVISYNFESFVVWLTCNPPHINSKLDWPQKD